MFIWLCHCLLWKTTYNAILVYLNDQHWYHVMFYTHRCHAYIQYIPRNMHTVFALLCFVVVIHWLIFPYPSGLLHWHCGNLAIAPSASKATLMNMDKYFMWIHYERLHNHNNAKHNKTVCIFLGIYCIYVSCLVYHCLNQFRAVAPFTNMV